MLDWVGYTFVDEHESSAFEKRSESSYLEKWCSPVAVQWKDEDISP